MVSYVEQILRAVVSIINAFGYWGIAGGMILESACIPLPSEVVLPLGGNMISERIVTMFEANAAAALGSLIGSLLAYSIGYYGGRPFILKYGKFFFVSEKHFYKAEKTFRDYGIVAVFFGRLLPVVRTFISLPAGIAKMDPVKFVLYSLIGMLPWNFILIYLGYKFGQQYETVVRPIFHKFEFMVIAVMGVAILFLLLKYLQGRKNKSYKAS